MGQLRKTESAARDARTLVDVVSVLHKNNHKANFTTTVNVRLQQSIFNSPFIASKSMIQILVYAFLFSIQMELTPVTFGRVHVYIENSENSLRKRKRFFSFLK